MNLSLSVSFMDIYKIGEAFGINVMESEQIKSNGFCIISDKGLKYFLKKSRVDKNDVDFIVDAYSFMGKNGFKSHLIDFCKTQSGGFYFLDKDDDIYLLTKWVESRKLSFKNMEDVFLAIDILHKLHETTINYTSSMYRKVLLDYPKLFRKKYAQIKAILNIIHQKENKDIFDTIYQKAAHLFLNRFEWCIWTSSKLYKLFTKHNCKVLIHHDTAHHNFLLANNNVYLIDFDYSMIDYDVHDFVNLAVRIFSTNNWDFNVARLFIKYLTDKNIIKKFWLEMFTILTIFPQEIWQVGIQYYFEKQPWQINYFIKRLKGAINIQKNKEKLIWKLWEVKKIVSPKCSIRKV